MTSMVSPSTAPGPSGSTASPSAPAIADSWWEPCPPAERARSSPSSPTVSRTRAKWTLPSGWRRSAPSTTARRRGRSGEGCPPIRRNAGRANSSKLTIEETGLPGRPNTGTSPTSPKANGLAGLIAICIQRMSPMRSSTTFTKSNDPMLTPPLVSTASQRATPSRSAASMRASSSGARPRSTASKPASSHRASRVWRLLSRI